jgi:transcriptional regulator with XRE-family HTH domain
MTGDQPPADASWSVRQAAGIGRRVARRRAQLRLSTQEVADRCAALGMDSLTRQVLSRLEHGRRESVSTAELAVIAAALRTAPVLLLYPIGLGEQAEYLPGRFAPPFDAARWWGDEADLSDDGDIVGIARRSAAMLFRDHVLVLGELSPDATEAAYLAARRRQGEQLADKERLMMLSIVALREIREGIRQLGLEPPELPFDLKWLDEPGG